MPHCGHVIRCHCFEVDKMKVPDYTATTRKGNGPLHGSFKRAGAFQQLLPWRAQHIWHFVGSSDLQRTPELPLMSAILFQECQRSESGAARDGNRVCFLALQEDPRRCGTACGATLPCAHVCQSKCGECLALTLHPPGQPRQPAEQQVLPYKLRMFVLQARLLPITHHQNLKPCVCMWLQIDWLRVAGDC